MEVCIFGVLTVDMFFKAADGAPLPQKCSLSRCLLKMAG